MRLLILISLGCAITGIPLVGFAETAHFKCTFDKITNAAYIAPNSVVIVDLDNWKAKVEDSVEMKALGSPVRAIVTAQNDKRISLSWTVENLPHDMTTYGYRRTHKLFYSLSIFSNGKAKVLASSRMTMLSDGDYSAVGNCEKVK